MKEEEIEIGKRVYYYPVIRKNGEKIGKTETVITSKPWQLGHGDVVCKIKGVSGGVLITHLEEI